MDLQMAATEALRDPPVAEQLVGWKAARVTERVGRVCPPPLQVCPVEHSTEKDCPISPFQGPHLLPHANQVQDC